jgi:hypothetical protein
MMQKGTEVEFTTGPLGLTKNGKFTSATANVGQKGEYLKPHPTIEGWVLIGVGGLICPCSPEHFKVVGG